MQVTLEQMHICFPSASAQLISSFLEPLNETIDKYQINTPQRLSCFMAQIAHESACLKYTRELSDGKKYEHRTDLGNIDDGDGQKYVGRGLIQVTGRNNYIEVSEEFAVRFTDQPELLEGPMFASLSAGWFWKKKYLNSVADKNDSWRRNWKGKDWNKFYWISILINGYNSKIGEPNGMPDRLKYYELSKKAFGLS